MQPTVAPKRQIHCIQTDAAQVTKKARLERKDKAPTNNMKRCKRQLRKRDKQPLTYVNVNDRMVKMVLKGDKSFICE